MAREKMDLVEEYLTKLFNVTADMQGKMILKINSPALGMPITLKADVGDHDKHVFKGDKLSHIAWDPQSPFLEVYQDIENVYMYWMPNHLTVNVEHVYNALKFRFGTVWDVTLEEYIAHKKELDKKHRSGYHRYEMYQMHVCGCKYDRKNGLKPRA